MRICSITCNGAGPTLGVRDCLDSMLGERCLFDFDVYGILLSLQWNSQQLRLC